MKESNPERYKHKILLKKTRTTQITLRLLKKLNIAEHRSTRQTPGQTALLVNLQTFQKQYEEVTHPKSFWETSIT